MADMLIAGGVPGAEEVDEGVEDDEGGIKAGHDGLEDGQIAGEGEGAAGSVPSGTATKATMRPGRHRRRRCGGGWCRRGRPQRRRGGHRAGQPVRRRHAREGIATGDAGGELAEEGALAEAGIAIEDGDLAGGDATWPEPAQGLRGDVAEADGVPEQLAAGAGRDANFLRAPPAASKPSSPAATRRVPGPSSRERGAFGGAPAARMRASILASSSGVARLGFSIIWFPPVDGRCRPSLPARCETLTPAPPRGYPALRTGRGARREVVGMEYRT